MTRRTTCLLAVVLICLLCRGHADGRGFGWGGYRGGYHYGGYGGYHYGGYRTTNWGGYNRNYNYSGYRSGNLYSGWRGVGGTSSYDRTWTGSRGGSLNVEGNRGVASGLWGGTAAWGNRNVTATGPEGRSLSGSRQWGAAVGPYGRVVGGGQRSWTATGRQGSLSGGWQSAFGGTRFATDFGLGHYSALNTVAPRRVTNYWSRSYMAGRANAIRANWGYFNSFNPGWYTAHPGCWLAAGWAAGAAWTAANWSGVSSWCSLPPQPITYDYGGNVVYQGNNVYIDGLEICTAPQFAQQATNLAVLGQQAKAPPSEDWKPLGVFALVQGDEKTSNNIFQLAINKDGIIRGNYYDGLMDTTTPVYGSMDKKTQRAAWTIGKKTDRVFEAGLDNLTQDEAPVLVHLGADRTQQWMLVRMQSPQSPQ